MTEYDKTLRATNTSIPGLSIWDLPVHGDQRGWFKENWQREKMTAAGLPDFGPVQNNISYNGAVGTTRGIHAEPWDKFVSVASGRIFGAWVDMRSGTTFGRVFTAELDPSRAAFVPRGVGNAFQTLTEHTVYTYLVNDHYSRDAAYASVNVADDAMKINWPIPLQNAKLSTKDRNNPRLAEIVPIAPRRTLVIGAHGQLGSALRGVYGDSPRIEFADRSQFDLTSANIATIRRWRDYEVVINAAAHTAVDGAETMDGRSAAWATNVSGVASLARVAIDHGITLVHVSSDYVFDGTVERPYREDDPVSPLGVYGQTKAAGDYIVSTVPRHYIVRTSWVIGEGRNFVNTMKSLAERGANPLVVNDQHGRLTFASELGRAIRHLIDSEAPYGIYNVSGAGPVMSWADVARMTFALTGHNPDRVTGVSTETYFSSFSSTAGPIAPRPCSSVLELAKIESTGFSPKSSVENLATYLRPVGGPPN